MIEKLIYVLRKHKNLVAYWVFEEKKKPHSAHAKTMHLYVQAKAISHTFTSWNRVDKNKQQLCGMIRIMISHFRYHILYITF